MTGTQCPPVVLNAMAEAGWPNPVQPGLPPVSVLMQGQESFFEVTLTAEPDPPLLTCTIAGPPPLPRLGRRRVCEALNRANANLHFGRFELDMHDGRLRFVSSIPLHECIVGAEAVELLVFVGIAEFDEYLPPFLEVSAGNLPPSAVG